MQIHLLRSIQNSFVCLFLPIPVNVVFAVVGVVIVDHELHIVHIQASEIIKLSKVRDFTNLTKGNRTKGKLNSSYSFVFSKIILLSHQRVNEDDKEKTSIIRIVLNKTRTKLNRAYSAVCNQITAIVRDIELMSNYLDESVFFSVLSLLWLATYYGDGWP